MLYDVLLSKKEREKLFHTQLVKHDIKHDKAAKAAKILASGLPDELLTKKEKQLVIEVCKEWAVKYKRQRISK